MAFEEAHNEAIRKMNHFLLVGGLSALSLSVLKGENLSIKSSDLSDLDKISPMSS